MYRPMQQSRARVLLARLLATPKEWKDHIELYENWLLRIRYILILLRFQGEMILDMTYGYEVKGRHDKKLDVSKRLNDHAIAILPGALLVNELPFCTCSPTFAHYIKLIITFPVRHIPAWVPYMSYQPIAQFWP